MVIGYVVVIVQKELLVRNDFLLKFMHVLPRKVSQNLRYVRTQEFHGFFVHHSYLYTGYIFYDSYEHRKLLYGMNIYSREMPGTTITKENGRTAKRNYHFKFSSFRRRPPWKLISTIILELDPCFWWSILRRSIHQSYTTIFIFNMLFSSHFPILYTEPTKLYPKDQHIHLPSST